MEDRVDEVSDETDEFPVGLRVLVVDDDLCSLKLVETILKKCKYNVTTCSQPLEALKMLREDKNRFEIVITDVNMPGMDGFKLLEVIGLEMDLPVIMLSAHSNHKFVMKGVQHGACDYLVKPCRMMELRNIWLHVYKRKHMNQRDKNKNSSNQYQEQGSTQPENPETCSDSKACQKRKGRNEEDENGESETEDPAQKKQRLVWSIDLHQKFVAAINHFTVEKAVPKKILDWMNVEGLTRENVASHLQKYRLYLKRLEAGQNKPETPIHMRSLEAFGLPDPGSRRFPTVPFSSAPASGVLRGFNSSSGLKINPGLLHQNTSQPMNSSFGLRRKLPQSPLSELFQGNQRSSEVNPMSNLSGLSFQTSLASSMNPGPRLSANPLFMRGNQRALRAAQIKRESFDNHHLSKFLSTGFRSFETQYHHQMGLNSSRLSHAHSPIGQPSMNAVQNPQASFQADIPCEEGLIGSVVQIGNCSQQPKGEEHDLVFEPDPNHSAMNPQPLGDETMDHNSMETVNNLDLSEFIDQSGDNMEPFGELNREDELGAEQRMNFDVSSLNMGADESFSGDFGTLEDMVNVNVTHDPSNGGTSLMDEVYWPEC